MNLKVKLVLNNPKLTLGFMALPLCLLFLLLVVSFASSLITFHHQQLISTDTSEVNQL